MHTSREHSSKQQQDLTLYFIKKRAEKGLEDTINDPDYPLRSDDVKKKATFFIDQEGPDFYCRENIIKFNDPASVNAKVFRAIFKHADGSGLASYEDINAELEQNGEVKLADRNKVIQRIRNAVQNLFRYSNLPKETTSGEKLLETSRGKGIIFRNPRIK